MSLEEEVRQVLEQALGVASGRLGVTRASSLLGSVAELDSMAVVNVIAALEDRFRIQFDDDEISADTFATFGGLVDLVAGKVSQT